MEFIRTYDIFDKEFCDNVIATFNKQKEFGKVYRRDDKVRRDTQLEFNSSIRNKEEENKYDEMDFRNDNLAAHFFEKIGDGLKLYIEDLGLTTGGISASWFKNMLVQC